jgi:hypothetical protein
MKVRVEEALSARSPLERYEDVERDLREKWEEELKAAIEAEYRRQRTYALLAVQWWLRDVWLHTLAGGRELLNFPALAGAERVADAHGHRRWKTCGLWNKHNGSAHECAEAGAGGGLAESAPVARRAFPLTDPPMASERNLPQWRATVVPPWVFSGLFGAFLGLALLKFGNPPIMERFIERPANLTEWIIMSWPVEVGYWLLGVVAVVGLFAARWPTGVPKWVLVLPLVWLAWQFVRRHTPDAA